MLNKKEKDYLWSKIEYNKKKKAKEKENDIYQMLQGDKEIKNDNDFIKILDSLEYSFKKKLKNGTIDNNEFLSIQEKLPKDWLDVKYSNLKMQKNKRERKPTMKNTKKEIADYLDKNKIKYDNKMSKSQMLELFENGNILTWHGFNI